MLRILKLAIKLAIIIFVLILIFLICIFFVSQSRAKVPDYSQEQALDVDYMKNEAVKYLGIEHQVVSLDENTVNKLISDAKPNVDDALSDIGDKVTYLGSWIDFEEDKIIMYSGVYSEVAFIKHRTIIKTVLNVVSEENKISFDVESIKIGNVAFPLTISKKVISTFFDDQLQSISDTVDNVEIGSDFVVSILVDELDAFVNDYLGDIPADIVDMSFQDNLLIVNYMVDATNDAVFDHAGNVMSYLLSLDTFRQKIDYAVSHEEGASKYLDIIDNIGEKIVANKVGELLEVDNSQITDEDRDEYFKTFESLERSVQEKIVNIFMIEFESDFPESYALYKAL